MSSIPANLSRVPNLLRSQILRASLGSTSTSLLRLQEQLASGKAVSRFSDNSIAASAISVLRQRLADGEQIRKNLNSAQNSIDYLDSSVGDAVTLAQEAKSVASGQIGATSDAATRNNQAVVIDGLISQLFQLSNRSTNALYVFGGSTASQPPIETLRGGFRYTGRGTGLLAQLGFAGDVPITIGGENAIGETSARVRSAIDLDPALTTATKLTDLNGARRFGITKGIIEFQFDTGPVASIDLSNADTAGDIATAIEAALQQYEAANSVTILGPGGVSVSGGSLSIDVVTGSPNPNLTFRDVGTGVTAQDLGLSQAAFSATSAVGASLDPRLTLLTPVTALSGVTTPLGTVRFRFTSGSGSSITDVNLAGATTIDDLRSRIESAVPGIRVSINSAGTGIDVVSEISGPALSIEPVSPGPDTATQLGIRTTAGTTRIADLNDGRGVAVVDNQTDPVTGTVTRALNTDFRIFLGNGQAFDVDLRPQDLTDISTLLARINSEFNTAVGQPPVVTSAPALVAGQFTAQLVAGQNGIAFTQTGVTGTLRVEKLNNSGAAEDLGLMSGRYDATSATLIAQDRGAVRVNNLFGALIRLRDALRADDSPGIAIAGSEVETAINRLAETQALVGVYANRLTVAQSRQEDENILHERMKSELQDLDFADAAIRLNTLQTQLQASYQVSSRLQNLSLMDFLG